MASQVLGQYVIEATIDGGGMGVVYRARDVSLDRTVAIKVLAPHMQQQETAWGRILYEARILSSLNHPHICTVYAVGEEAGLAYIAMEFVQGEPLSVALRKGPLPAIEVVRYGTEIADALGYAHGRRIIHGDLRSANIMITPDAHVKVLDFGLARRLESNEMESITTSHESLGSIGPIAGTLPYLAPEVLRGHSANIQSDIWSFGVLLHEMLAGRLPFVGQTPFDLSASIMTSYQGPLPHPVPRRLRKIVARCLEKSPARRYKSATEVLQELGTVIVSPRLRVPYRLRGYLAKRPTTWVPAACLLLIGSLLSIPPLRRVVFKPSATPPHTNVVTPALTEPNRRGKVAHPAGDVPTANPDVKVWLNKRTATYHCPGTRWYGRTKEGVYMSQKEALEKGYRPAFARACE